MKITSFDAFKELAQRGTFVPVVKELVADLLTPVSAFLKIAEDADYAFLLESVEGGEQVGRYSFLGKDPFLILRARDGRTTLERGGTVTAAERPFIETLRGIVVRAGPRRCRRCIGRGGSGRVHAVRHRPRVRSRPASDPDHCQRAHHRRRRPRVAVSVCLRQDRLPGTRARTKPVDAGPAEA